MNDINKLVDRIVERGRLLALEEQGILGVKDGGIDRAKQMFGKNIENIVRENVLLIVNEIIGRDMEVLTTIDIREGEEVPDWTAVAVNDSKHEMRERLQKYMENAK